MTPQEIIHAAERLSFKDLVYLVSQLMQLVASQVAQPIPEKPVTADTKPTTMNFRELSGLLYRVDQPTVSIDEMNAAIEAEAG